MLKVILSYLLITISLSAQWNWISPSETSAFWYSFEVYDDDHFWLAGEHGIISNTTDGGENWNIQRYQIDEFIVYLKFFSLEEGYAFREKYDHLNIESRILKTTDSGNTWSELPQTFDGHLIKIVYDTENRLHAITERAVLTSTDYGQTWSMTALVTDNEKLTDIEVIHDGRIWITSDGGKILEADETAENWNTIQTGEYDFERIITIDENTTYILCERAMLLKTFDSGVTWTYEGANIGYARFIDFVSKDVGYLFNPHAIGISEDGGLTWEQVVEIPSGDFNSPKIKFVNNKAYYLDDRPVVLKRTDNLGESWQNLTTERRPAPFELKFLNNQVGFAGGYGNLMKTTDSGFTWYQVLNDEHKYMGNIEFITDHLIYMYAGYGVLYKSTDQGETWSANIAPAGHAMQFLNENVGYLTDNDLYLHKTTDGGANWKKSKLLSGLSHLNDCAYISESEGWIVGGRLNTPGIILRTVDGTNYDLMYSNDEFDLFKVKTNGSAVWVSGVQNYQESIILASFDDGASWQKIMERYNISDFHLFSKSHGIVVTTDGLLLETYDSGESWEETVLPMPEPIAIHAFDREHIWICDRRGGIISTISEPIIVSVEENTPIDKEYTFSLGNNYPNPFNPTTTIIFTLPESQKISLKVFNILGKEVATLVDGSVSSGEHNIKFDGTNLSSGIYFYQLVTPENSITKKMILMK